MIKVNVKIRDSFFKQLRTVSTEAGRKSMAFAINDALKTGKTTLKRETCKKYNIKQKNVDANTKIERCTETSLKKGEIRVESRRLTVGTSTQFSHTPKAYSSQKGVKVAKRKKISVTVKKGSKKQMHHAFIANPASIKGGNTMVWIRERNSIAPLKTVSVPQMATNKEVIKEVSEAMCEKYENRFEHYWNRNMRKLKG